MAQPIPMPIPVIGEAVEPHSSAPCRAADVAPALRLLHHSIYEHTRGVRGLFLMTVTRRELRLALAKLEALGIVHFVQELSAAKANLYFGRPAFVAAARSFVTRPLNELTAEEDFMLGTLLGYDCEQQCRRYLTRSGRRIAAELARTAACAER